MKKGIAIIQQSGLDQNTIQNLLQIFQEQTISTYDEIKEETDVKKMQCSICENQLK